MARQIQGAGKRERPDAHGQAGRATEPAKKRPAVDELMAMSEDQIRDWMRSVGLKSASDLGIRAE